MIHKGYYRDAHLHALKDLPGLGMSDGDIKVNFNKPGGGTGRLRACDDCANAMKTVRAASCGASGR